MADSKLTDLTENTDPQLTDLLYIVDDPGGSPASQKVTIGNVLDLVAVDSDDVTYTPTTLTDWDGDADPGDVEQALDQLAERVDDLEAAGGGGDSTYTDTYANKPAAGNAGDLFFPSNGFVVERDTGAAWAPWGPIFPLTKPPAVSGLTWVNQGAATAIETYGGIALFAPAVSGDQLRILKKSAPSTPYTFTIGFIPDIVISNYLSCGIALRQSSDGKVITHSLAAEGGGTIRVAKWNSPSSWNGNYTYSSQFFIPNWLFLRVTDDGVNRVSSWSKDGQNFTQLHSVGRTDFLTADEIGIFCNSNNASLTALMTLLSWKEA